MSVITVFGASFTGVPEVAERVAARLDARLVPDEDLLDRAARTAGETAARVRRALRGSPGLSLKPDLARSRLVAHLRAAVAELLAGDGLVCPGPAGLLVPARVSHFLRVCLVAPVGHRTKRAVGSGLSPRKAAKEIHRDDETALEWARYVHGRGPWDRRQYDLRLPMQQITRAEAVDAIAGHAARRTVAATPASRAAFEDFALAARAAVLLADAGQEVDVLCEDRRLEVLVNRQVLSFERLEAKLGTLLAPLAGVESIRARPGSRYPAGSFYREEEFHLPSRVLLVDDESEFVMALSERLEMREIESSVAMDGLTALSLVEKEEPEVVVLDLRMPGVDGIEVLRRLKRDHPAVEVIILTGHGTEEDEALTRDLGAFAYLQKPVDIEELTRTMEAANEKIRRARDGREEEEDG